MKKIVIFLLIFYVIQNSTFAQGFEGAHMDDSFQKELDRVGTTSIVGMTMFYKDYGPDPALITVKNHLLPEQGMSYALLLIQNPSVFKLKKVIVNLIITTNGSIIIFYSEKTKQWELLFASTAVGYRCPLGCRIFELS